VRFWARFAPRADLVPITLPSNAQRPGGNTVDDRNIDRWRNIGRLVAIEPSPSGVIRSDMTTNVCARCNAAPTRNVMAARSRPSSALVHPSCTTCLCFVETRRHSRYLHASHQCNRDAIPRGLKNALRLARFQHINSYLSAYRQLRVSVSNRPRLHMLYGTTGCYRGRCTSVRESASPFWLGEGTRLSPPAWSD
jgi:hypothetical protein